MKNIQVLCAYIKVCNRSLNVKGVILSAAFQNKWFVVIIDAKALGLSVIPFFKLF